MATLSSNNLTLADWAKRVDPDGKVETMIAEILNQSNQILDDAVFVEGNTPTGHRVVIRTGLPTVYWRALNQGVPRSKSTTSQVDESCGFLEAFAAIDKDIAELNGNTAAFRLSEEAPFIESMSQSQAQTLFYGNPATDKRQYLGLSARYSAISGAGNAQNIIDAGGTSSNNTSIWLVIWSDQTVFCPFPKGSKAGLIMEDDGLLTIYDANGNPYKAYQTHYQWKNGLVVKDWRYVVRICNINTANLVAESAAADLLKLMSRALDRIPNMDRGRACFYMNRTVHSMLRIQALNKSQNAISIEQAAGQAGTAKNWAALWGIPMRRVDQLLNTEARVV